MSEQNMRYINPGYKHEERRKILSDMAIIAGYDLHLSRGLPDGTIPDVLRMDSSCGAIFLGEAKDTESAGYLQTKQRILTYLSWFRFMSAHQKGSIFVLCVGNKGNMNRWKSMLAELSTHSGIKNSKISSDSIDHENFLIILKLL